MNRYLFLAFLVLLSTDLFSQNITISGYMSDKQTGERLIGATVYNKTILKGTTTNNYGFYSLTIPSGNIKLESSFVGYEKQQIELYLKEDTILNFDLQQNMGELDEVTVRGDMINKADELQMSMIKLPVEKIQKVPAILGEADVLKVVQLFPGIQSGTEGTSGIYVRGGNSDQNLFLIDGVPIYNASHLLGFFSTFDPDAIKTVTVYTGGFPARFGGRLSSVVDVHLNDGNLKELHGNFSVGLISSKLTLEGPIAKDKTSFMLSLRRTYADLIVSPILAYNNRNNDSKMSLDLYFYDINAKLSHKFSDRSKVYLSIYNGQDKYAQGEKNDSVKEYSGAITSTNHSMGMGWTNTVSSLRWNYLLSNKLFCNTSISYSKFLFDVENSETKTNLKEDFSETAYYRYYSGVEDFAFKAEFDYFPSQKHKVSFGSGAIHHQFNPGVSTTKDNDKNNSTKGASANEFSAYVEDGFLISETFNMNFGVHLSLFNTDGKNYFRPQPRISLNYKPHENIAIKASYSRMAQHIHLLNSSGLELPMDLWVPVTARFEPPTSDQVAIGTAFTLANGFNLTVECFYKSMKHLIEYQEGASFTGGGVNWEDIVEKGIGWSYGAEFLLEKTIGKTTGWLGYTWSKTERQFDNINFGKTFPYKYDRRHNLSLVITHKFNERIDISGIWVFNTGTAATLAFTKYPVIGIPTYNSSSSTYFAYNCTERNGYRLPNYHRLDLGVNFKKQKKHGVRTWNFSLYNVYNHLNPFLLTWKTDYDNYFLDENAVAVSPKKLYILSLLPIIPSISYSYKF